MPCLWTIRKESVRSKHPYFGSTPRIPISLHSLWEILCIVQFLVQTPNRTYTSTTYFCLEGLEGFHFDAELQRHMNVHNDVKPFGCDLCAKQFTQNKSLTRHKKVHDDNPVTCSMCDKTCQTPEQMYTHFRGAHGKGYRAPCGELYQWPVARA